MKSKSRIIQIIEVQMEQLNSIKKDMQELAKKLHEEKKFFELHD